MGLSSFLGGLGGGAIGSAVVKLYADTTAYKEGLAAAKEETTAFGISAATAYTAAGLAAASFAVSAIRSASEHQQVLAALTAQVGNNTQAFEDQATALQNVTGYQDELILSADTVLSRFKLTQAQVQQAIPVLLDYARATGKDVPDAAKSVGKALLGNTRALKEVGINYKVTGNAAKDYDNILGLLNDKVGGQAAAYATTFAGKLEILAAKFDDFKESAGAPLIGNLSAAADAVSTLADDIQHLGDVMPKPIAGIFSLKNVITAVVPQMGTFYETTQQAADAQAQAAQAAYDATPAIAGMGDASQKAAEQADKAAQAAKDERAAFLSLSGGTLGLISDLQSLHDNQKELQRLQEKGKEGTYAWRQATLAVLQSQLALSDDLRDVASKMREAGASSKDITDRLRYLAAQAGVSKDKFREFIDSVGGLRGVLQGLNDTSTKIHIDTSELDLARAKADRLRDIVRAGL